MANRPSFVGEGEDFESHVHILSKIKPNKTLLTVTNCKQKLIQSEREDPREIHRFLHLIHSCQADLKIDIWNLWC